MKILIVNLHSALNLGDEAIMRQTLALIKSKFPDANITLMANDPKSWNIIEEVKIVPSLISFINETDNKGKHFFAILQILAYALIFKIFRRTISNHTTFNDTLSLIQESDLILSAGGGNFYSNTYFGRDFVLNILPIYFSAMLKKALIMLPQSFGPLKTDFQKRILQKSLQGARTIYVREKEAQQFLFDIGVAPNKIQPVPDLVFWNEIPDLKSYQTNEKKKIGITIIDRGAQSKDFNSQRQYELEIKSFIDQVLDKTNYEIFLFVQCFGPSSDQDDTIVTTRVFNNFAENNERVHLLKDYKVSRDLFEDLSKMDLMISSRMHSAIFSIVNNVPSILIGYQPKAKGLYKLCGFEDYYFDIKNVSGDNLFICTIDMLKAKDSITKQSTIIHGKFRQEIREGLLEAKW